MAMLGITRSRLGMRREPAETCRSIRAAEVGIGAYVLALPGDGHRGGGVTARWRARGR